VVTAVVSDLHLGARTGGDLLRRPEIRRRLMDELEAVDHVVLLGDSVDLRAGPPAQALEAAAPFFDDLGAALAGGRVTIVPGNHDHKLASSWLGRAVAEGGDGRLGLQHVGRLEPNDLLTEVARRMPAVELVVAYPGVWLRPDVYATHGHYLDCHNQVATFECLARALSERLSRPRGRVYRTPADYEAVLAPVYRAIDRVAGSPGTQRLAGAAKAMVRAWESAAGYRGGRRPGLAAMAQVVDGLGIEARYVLFGHMHRAGPRPGEGERWRTAIGAQLVNAGCWVYEPAYLGATSAQSPYWPGTVAFLRDDRRPELKHLLEDVTPAQLGAKCD
jgi:predicted phosphodiesterase